MMPVDEKTKTALAKESLSLPPSPLADAIEAIEAAPYVDSSGEDSLEVWVILNDSIRDEDLTGEAVMQVKATIRESLLENGVNLFPYIRFVDRSDYQDENKSA